MNKFLTTERGGAYFALLVVVLMFIVVTKTSPEDSVDTLPFPDGTVTDVSGVIPDQAEEQVERMIRQYEHSIYVYVDTQNDISGTTQAIHTKWNLGKNDTLLVITADDAYILGDKGGLNQESREEIIDFAIRPYLVEQDYAEALRTGVFSINEIITE